MISKMIILSLLLLPTHLYSQNCEVETASLKGAYTGDCKKGKANGKGRAIGIDTYEGEFKNGVPDGQGTYTWNNKNVFNGKYIKGLRDGKGIMTFKNEGGQDSVVDGYWKKDIYIGKHERPWQVMAKTGSVTKVDVEYSSDNNSRIKVIVTNTSGGVTTLNAPLAELKVDNIIVLKGFFERRTSLELHFKSTETTLLQVTFPFHGKFQIGKDEVEIEFYETGSYTVNISVNN